MESIDRCLSLNLPVQIRADPDALSLASQLRSYREHEQRGCLAVAFAPISNGVKIGNIVEELAHALVQIGEGPVLVLCVETGEPTAVTRRPAAKAVEASAAVAQGAAPPPLPDLPTSGVATADMSGDRGQMVATLSSERFRTFVAEARHRFRYLVFQGSPPAENIETILAGRQSDVAILIAAKNITRMSEAKTAGAALARNGIRLLGYVFDTRPVRAPKRKTR